MSAKKGSSSGGIIIKKKGSNNSIMIPEIHVCPHLIRDIKSQVKKWETYTDIKIAGILTRALADSDLWSAKKGRAFYTTVTLSVPGGKHQITIPLKIEVLNENQVQLSLNNNKPLKIIPFPTHKQVFPLQT